MHSAGRASARAAGIALSILWLATAASADVSVWRVTGGYSSLTISEAQLAATGLVLEHRTPVSGPPTTPAAPGVTRRSFPVSAADELTFRTRNGAFRGFLDETATLRHEGGFVLQSEARERN